MAGIPTTYTFYKSNVDSEIVEAQASVFAHFGIPLVQQLDDSSDHSRWLTKVMRDDSMGELVVVADIDAFPLSLNGYKFLTDAAKAGGVSGLAQVANHKNPDHIYAGPMFLSVRRDVYRQLGAPDMRQTKHSDVAQILTLCAEETGIQVSLIWPKFAISPRWSLAQHGIFGIGTFYGENEFFHLFEARKRRSKKLLLAVAEGVIKDRHDFDRYLAIFDLTPPKRKKFLRIF